MSKLVRKRKPSSCPLSGEELADLISPVGYLNPQSAFQIVSQRDHVVQMSFQSKQVWWILRRELKTSKIVLSFF